MKGNGRTLACGEKQGIVPMVYHAPRPHPFQDQEMALRVGALQISTSALDQWDTCVSGHWAVQLVTGCDRATMEDSVFVLSRTGEEIETDGCGDEGDSESLM